MQYPITLPQEIFLDLHYKLSQLTHSYSRTSTNPKNTQHSTTNNNQLNNLHPFSTYQPSNITRNKLPNTQFQTSDPPSTTIRTIPHIITTYTQPFTNRSNISSNVSNIYTYNTVPPSTIPQSTVSQPTYKNSSTSISEYIEARVTLQPTSDHEYNF